MIFTELRRKTAVMYIAMMVMIMLVIARLYAVMNSGTASQVLSGQYTRRIDVAERRGFIYDRNGELLNMAEDGFICIINPKRCTDFAELSEAVCKVSAFSQSEIYDKLIENMPFTLVTESMLEFEGLECYPLYCSRTVCAPHIVGYTDRDGKGVFGVEKYFDRTLSEKFSGKVSYRYMSDALGGVMENTGSCIYDSGYGEESGIYLTVDSELQMYCEELAKKYGGSGAVCVTDTNSGEVLACVSFPGFDAENVADYLGSEKGELVNRGISLFTPGSVFKTVVAAAALETDRELYLLEYECVGSFETEDGEIIPCHKKDGHGIVDMKTAYAQSCNPYFINLALAVGESAIIDMAQRMGFREECSLDGIFSYGNSIARYDEGVSSKGGYMANLAIGQGRTLVSPLSTCSVFSCAVTGKYTQPGVLLKICEGDVAIRDYSGLRESVKVLSDRTSECLSEMMMACVEQGLGKDAKPEEYGVGGKTATAQTGRFEGENEILNCWFCGVYPADKPEYTVCVLYCGTENGDTAKKMFREISGYLALDLENRE